MLRDNLNAKGFAVMNGFGNINACTDFAYKGFIISMSTLMGKAEVVVFRDDPDADADYQDIVSRHDSVQLAIEHVNDISSK